MLYVLSQFVYSEEEAAKATERKLVRNTLAEFLTKTMKLDLNKDPFFVRCCREIDMCDIPMDNVLRDLITGKTHSFDKVSGGVMALWLMYYCNDKYIIPSSYFGENCYSIMVEISKDRDIYIYEDSVMFYTKELSACDGVFTDFKTSDVVSLSNDVAFHYAAKMGY